MTKFVIQSGGLKHYPDKSREYFAELFKDLEDHPKLLWCFFASKEFEFRTQYAEYQTLFSQAFPPSISPLETNATLGQFVAQVADADIIYFHGGDPEILRKHLSVFDIAKMIEGKVVGTNSASTLLFSDSGWSADSRSCMDGYGILPIRSMVHYNSQYGADEPEGAVDWITAKAALETYGDVSLPIHALEEGDYIVIEK